MSVVEEQLLPKRKTRLVDMIEAMQVELNKLSCPKHISFADLDDINDLIDRGALTPLKFKEVVFNLTYKPPQVVRYFNIEKSSFDRGYMMDWRDTKTSIFVEVRLNKETGEYLRHNQWEVIHRTDEEVHKLLGIFDYSR